MAKLEQTATWEEIEQVLRSTDLGHVLLWGPPGIGKTRAARRIYPTGAANPYCINVTEETAAFELRGYDRMTRSGMEFSEGPVLKAQAEGRRVVIDEIGRSSGDAASFLLGAMDGNDIAESHLPDGRVIKPQPGFHVVGTSNAPPEDMEPALLDRFSLRICVTTPPPGAFVSLEPELMEAAIELIAVESGRQVVSIRPWFAVQKLRRVIPERLAFKMVFNGKGDEILNALEAKRAAKASGVAQ